MRDVQASRQAQHALPTHGRALSHPISEIVGVVVRVLAVVVAVVVVVVVVVVVRVLAALPNLA